MEERQAGLRQRHAVDEPGDEDGGQGPEERRERGRPMQRHQHAEQDDDREGRQQRGKEWMAERVEVLDVYGREEHEQVRGEGSRCFVEASLAYRPTAEVTPRNRPAAAP